MGQVRPAVSATPGTRVFARLACDDTRDLEMRSKKATGTEEASLPSLRSVRTPCAVSGNWRQKGCTVVPSLPIVLPGCSDGLYSPLGTSTLETSNDAAAPLRDRVRGPRTADVRRALGL